MPTFDDEFKAELLIQLMMNIQNILSGKKLPVF